MRPHALLMALASCALACAALLLPGAAAQFQRPNCMSGVPCGQFCAPMGGSCMRGDCFDASGMQVQCYAPMAPMNRGPGMFGFPPFLTFQPFAPMPPMVPMVPGCGGRGPCASNEFCDPTGVCRADDCVSQYTFGCPDDKGQLQKVACPHFSGFNRCYASSGGFSCNKGPSGGSVACASRDGGSSTATMSGSYQGPNGASTGGFVSSSSSFTTGPQAQPVQGPITTTGPSTVTVVQQPPVTAAGSSAGVGGVAAGAGADAVATAPAATSGPVQAVPRSTAAVAPAAVAGASASGTTVPASSSSSGSAVTSGTRIVSSNPPEVPVLQPVISAVGTGAAAGTGVPTAAASKAAVTATSRTASGAIPTFITEGATRQTYVTPDGNTVTAFGSGPPGISMTNIASDGSSMASGSAMGDQQAVTTTTIPGGSSVTSTSFSNGPSFGPVGASASAVAGSSSGAGLGAGGQPLYTPFQTADPGNAATAQFVGGNNGAGTAGSSDSAAAAATTRPPNNSAGSAAAPAWMLGAAAAGLFVALWV